MNTSLAKPKRGSHKRLKAKRARAAGKVVEIVRHRCVERDGYCFIVNRLSAAQYFDLIPAIGICEGPSEWAHVGKHRRSKTRGQAAEVRHTTVGSAIACRKHHRLYDNHDFDIECFDAERGMDGTFRVVVR
jgi:hypothetical protein